MNGERVIEKNTVIIRRFLENAFEEIIHGRIKTTYEPSWGEPSEPSVCTFEYNNLKVEVVGFINETYVKIDGCSLEDSACSSELANRLELACEWQNEHSAEECLQRFQNEDAEIELKYKNIAAKIRRAALKSKNKSHK